MSRPEDNFYENAERLDKLLAASFSESVESEVFSIMTDNGIAEYFLKRVESVEWFAPLNKRGFFSPNSAPVPKPADQEGFYSVPQWNVLPYLERVSQQVSTPGNEKYIDDLLAIIKDVSNYRDSNGQHIDNYRTWYYFAKILVN